MPIQDWYDSVRNGKVWTPPQTMANLLQSRLRFVTAPLNPGMPTLHVKPRVLGAVRQAEAQEEIFRMVMPGAGMEDAMRDFSQSATMSPYAAIRVWWDTDAGVPYYNRFKVERVSARDCGWEPFMRRFTFHRFLRAFDALPSEHQSALRKERKEAGHEDILPWQLVEVFEVYHPGFRGGHTTLQNAPNRCPRSTWLRLNESSDGAVGKLGEGGMGTYAGTVLVKRCPIVIASFLEPADNEDIPPAEVASWLPPLRGLVQALVQINREVRTNNNIILYDERIEAEHIDRIQDAPSSAKIYVPIATDEHGVAQKMRPMEKSNNIQELLLAFNVFLSMFNEVLGVTPTNMGIAEQPRKSATEAGAIDRNSNIRTADRLKIVAQMWQEVGAVIMANQRDVLGPTVEILINKNLSQRFDVPDGEETEVTLRVDPIELGHLGKQNEIDQLLGWVTIYSNAFLQFRGALPRIIRENLRRVGKLMGIDNVDAYLDAPVIEEGPENRYIQSLETGDDMPVQEQDDHPLFIAYYGAILDRALGSTNPLQVPVARLKKAIEEHQRFLDQAQRGQNFAQGPGNAPSLIPGFDGQGNEQAGVSGSDSLFPLDKSGLLPG